MKKIILVLILLVIVVIIGWSFKIVFIGQSGNNSLQKFTITPGQGVNEISSNLKKQGLIDSSFVFESYLWFKKTENKILAGEHEINNSWSIRELVNALISGNAIDNEQSITIVEGWDLYDLAEYFEKNNLAKKDELFKLVGYPAQNNNQLAENFAKDYEFLTEKPSGVSLEGYLFPDTYRIFKDATLSEIISKMLNNFDKKVDSKILGDIDKQNLKLYDVLTLASIIEKEAKTAEDKKRVAGVYYNRLKIGMALQADPTVNYVTGKQTDRPSFDDLKADSPYNTYKYPNLPPGPICNPGLDSIKAAVYPDKNDYFYFINTPEGELKFAKTLEEHAQNRAKYFINN